MTRRGFFATTIGTFIAKALGLRLPEDDYWRGPMVPLTAESFTPRILSGDLTEGNRAIVKYGLIENVSFADMPDEEINERLRLIPASMAQAIRRHGLAE